MLYHEYTTFLHTITTQFGLDYDYLRYMIPFRENRQWPIAVVENILVQFAIDPFIC